VGQSRRALALTVDLTADEALRVLHGHRGERVLVAVEPRAGLRPPLEVEGVLEHWREVVRDPPPPEEPDPDPGCFFIGGAQVDVTGLSASALGGDVVPRGLAFHLPGGSSLTITWG
jgi:hypothetical protein